MITQDELKRVVLYLPETGEFFWKVRLSPMSKMGVPVGSKTGTGHLTIGIHGASYLLHRLAFLYMTGEMPGSDVDHKNSNGEDNRWSNLRQCTKMQNRHNATRSSKKNGLVGQRKSTQKTGKPFRASIMVAGICKHIGYFDSDVEAHRAYLIAKSVLHPFWDRSNISVESAGLDLSYPGNLSQKFQKYLTAQGF